VLEEYATIDAEDRELYVVTDDIDKVVTLINQSTQDEAREEMRVRSENMRRRWQDG
jgi:hypothetical protein